MLPFFLFKVVQEDFSQVSLASVLQRLHEKVLVFHHELLEFHLIQSFMLKFALVDFTHACTVKVLAWKEAEVVGEAAAGPPMAIICQCKLTQLFLLWIVALLMKLRALVLVYLLCLTLLLLLLQFLVHV